MMYIIISNRRGKRKRNELVDGMDLVDLDDINIFYDSFLNIKKMNCRIAKINGMVKQDVILFYQL